MSGNQFTAMALLQVFQIDLTAHFLKETTGGLNAA